MEELNYKLWSTKGARFQAHNRLISKNNKSVTAIAFLTAYLIIFGLIGVYQNVEEPFIPAHYIGFGSMAGSILVLIFAQLDGAQDYKLNAHLYHFCALEIGQLYNQIRIRKTIENPMAESDYEFCIKLEKKYTDLLTKYPNHEEIDHKLFMISKPDYFKNLSKFQIRLWHLIYFLKTSLIYYTFILAPPVLFTIYWLWYLN
ncbi:SLATT domain-containing protein [Arcticibacterium luteifluviistationis]|uniref:SLATT domain-containing protein n=1 Tax=Arcticibacterium luteifluviistationis TaxID=1784714 RepID=UPI00195517C8|nr:SLATT domain-containing protein [Arcticibacterium luteifluviistationis]